MFQIIHADAGAFGGIGPCIEFGADPALESRLPQGGKDGTGRHIAAIERRENKRFRLEALQVNVGNARRVIANKPRRIAAGGREVRRVRAEIDRRQAEYLGTVSGPSTIVERCG